ncbi:ATP/GTP-binding protein [Streptomyces musisoli]|uniref:ATP/GTP-binding protein n=1 Tax=Streptomyces musisoli TaxID=2802280 RepID=UPI0027D9E8EA|nr:ATP/GTP-binding protein [Streptomyces musisoli]
MLTRRSGLTAAVATLIALALGQGAAFAGDGKVVCDTRGVCRVVADDTETNPGHSGSGDSDSRGGGTKPECYDDRVGHNSVPCHLDSYGDWVNGRNCYFQKADPQPPPGDPRWEGHDPADGAVYDAYCPDNPAQTSQWFAQPPNGGPAVDPEVLAREAVKKMRLLGPDIASPRLAGKYTVGVPMWMWVNQSPTTYGPQSASASAGGVTVTATAKVSQIVWQMGDGATVTCQGPGTVYQASAGMTESPTCGHVYAKTSAVASGGTYRLTATSTWAINWEVTAGGGGQSGQLTQTQQSQMQVAIGEVQVVR